MGLLDGKVAIITGGALVLEADCMLFAQREQSELLTLTSLKENER